MVDHYHQLQRGVRGVLVSLSTVIVQTTMSTGGTNNIHVYNFNMMLTSQSLSRRISYNRALRLLPILKTSYFLSLLWWCVPAVPVEQYVTAALPDNLV